jgi:vacuolar-type H+-ATPase subunit H
MRAALAPVRAALLGRAREQAAEIVAGARRRAQEMTLQAQRDAGDLVREARDAGRAQGIRLAAAQRNRGRRDARSIVLGAQREVYEELRSQVRAAVCALRDGPGYGQLIAGLTATAAQVAGPGASVTEDFAGGVVACGPGVVVDCSLPRLADAAVDGLGADVAWLWTPGPRDRA